MLQRINKMETEKSTLDEKELVLIAVIMALIVIILFVYVYYLQPKTEINKQYSAKIIEINGDCEDCFEIKSLTDLIIKENNLKITSRETLDYNSKEAKDIINKYNIKTIPSLVIFSKNIEKIKIENDIFSIKKDYAVFDKSVPYIDLKTNEINGFVDITEIKTDKCKECASLSSMKSQLEKYGVKVENYEIINSSSIAGKEIISKNELNFAPALLISKDIEEYWWIFPQIKDSLVEKQDYYVLKNQIAPYIDIKTGNIKGKVDVTYIEDKSCSDCFNVTELKGSFESFGIYIDGEKYTDISSSEGKDLLIKYNITEIPTIILSKEIQDYESIKETLKQVGSFEKDNVFVFRKLDILNVKYQTLN